MLLLHKVRVAVNIGSSLFLRYLRVMEWLLTSSLRILYYVSSIGDTTILAIINSSLIKSFTSWNKWLSSRSRSLVIRISVLITCVDEGMYVPFEDYFRILDTPVNPLLTRRDLLNSIPFLSIYYNNRLWLDMALD